MAYQNSGNTVIDDSRNFTFSNVTIQNNGFLEITSSDAFQGTVAGYASGGRSPAFNASSTDLIDKFPFSSDTNATDVGDLSTAKFGLIGQSSTTHGYASCPITFPAIFTNITEKFPFATDTNAIKIGNLTQARAIASGQSSANHGYSSGGYIPTSSPIILNTIDKFPFAIDTNATDVGDLTQIRSNLAGQSSTTHGYASGGYVSPPTPTTNVIDKFPFSSDTNATDVGDLTQSRSNVQAGQSSTTSGYASGGRIPPANPIVEVSTIEKFPFATDTNATDIGDLTQARTASAGQSSTASGYTSGGAPVPALSNVIDKFPFSSDTNASDVGDLTAARFHIAGQQD